MTRFHTFVLCLVAAFGFAAIDTLAGQQVGAQSRQAAAPGTGDDEFIIVRENNYADDWPERFRSTDMLLDLDEGQLQGLRELHIMGGGQTSARQVRNIVELAKSTVIVVDLRQEPHGNIAGMPITWFRPYISDLELGTTAMVRMEDDFIALLRSTARVQVDSVRWTGGQDYDVLSSALVDSDSVLSNAEMVEQNGAGYRRYYVPVIPDDRQVADFEAFVRQMSQRDVSLYFQCWDGTGRSTEFMVMYDILRNGRDVSLETIAERHAAMGGINVLELPPQDSPNYARSAMRRDFIVDYFRKHTESD